MLRMLGWSWRTCGMHQNVSGNCWSKGEKKTHLGGLQMNHMTQEVKQLYQAVSTVSRNALGALVMSTPMKLMHYIDIGRQQGHWTRQVKRCWAQLGVQKGCRRCQITMGSSAMSKRTCYVEIKGQETQGMSRRQWGSVKVNCNHQNVGNGVGYDGIGQGMDGTMSGTHCEPQWIETHPLPEYKHNHVFGSQKVWFKLLRLNDILLEHCKNCRNITNMPKHSASLMVYHDKMIFSFNIIMQIYIYQCNVHNTCYPVD